MNNLTKILWNYIKRFKLKFIFLFFCSILLAIIGVVPIKITQLIIDLGFIEKRFNIILILSMIILILHFVKSYLSYYIEKTYIIIGQKIISCIRRDLYNKVLLLPMNFFTDNESIYINERIQEVNNLSGLFTSDFSSAFISILEFIFAIIILFDINITISIIMLIPTPFFFFIAKKMFKDFSIISNDLMEESANYTTKMNESIRGIEEIKLANNEDKEMKKIISKDEEMLLIQTNLMITMKKNTEIISLFSNILPIILYVAGGIIYINGSITLGGIISINGYVGKLYSPFITVSSLSLLMTPIITSVKRLNDQFYQNETLLFEKNGTRAIDKIENIELRNVKFSYDKKNMILKNINMKLYAGKKYQIIGKNGSGKTTLLKILLCLYQLDDGDILINKIDLNKLDKSIYRERISLISQKNFLYNDSIKNNILYSYEDYDKDKYNELLDIMNFNMIFSRLGISEDTFVGENGIKLSGGEIKKICIARALMKNADVYIFDESLSNLDQESKVNLLNYIDNKLKDKLIIIIEHSMKLDEYVDEKLYLNN